MRDLLKPQKINFMSGLLLLISSFNVNIKDTLAQEANIPTLEQVFEDTDSIECIVNQNVHQTLEGSNFTIGLSGMSGVFLGEIRMQDTENIDFSTGNWPAFDLNFDFFSTDINYKNGLANSNLDFYIFFTDRAQIYKNFENGENFELFLDSNNQNIANLNLFFTEITYFPLLNEIWIFSSSPDHLIRLTINQDNYQNLEVGPNLQNEQLFRSVSKATQILNHTILTQYSNGNCGSLSITTDGVFDLGNVLPENVSHLCNEDTDLIVNEREIGVFYFKKIDGNIDQVICNDGSLKPQITNNVEPPVDMELDMEVPVDMELDMEAPADMELIDDMEVPIDMELDMETPVDMMVPLDMGVDMEAPVDMGLIEDMEALDDMSVPVDMESIEDMEASVDMIVPPEMDLDMEAPVDIMVSLDMESISEVDKDIVNRSDKDIDEEDLDMESIKKKSNKRKDTGCNIDSGESINSSFLLLLGVLASVRRKRYS